MSGSRDSAACGCISHLLANWWGLHQSSGVPPELGARLSCLAGAEMERKGVQDVPWGLGSVSWGRSSSHSSVLLSGMDFTYACGVCWSCGEGLSMARIMRLLGLGR